LPRWFPILVTLSLLLVAELADAQSVDGPTPLASPSSVRFAGMGYTGVAVADVATEAGAVWFNPALVAFGHYHQDRPDGTLLVDPKIEEVAAAQLFYAAVGWSAGSWVRADDRPARFFFSFADVSGDTALVSNNLGEVTTAFEPRQRVYAGGIALQSSDAFAWGVTVKYVDVDLRPFTAVAPGFVSNDNAVVFDVGMLYHDPKSRVSWGAALQNVGTKLALGTGDDTMPRALRGGVALAAMESEDGQHAVTVTADLLLPLIDIGDGPIILAGGEYRLAGIAALRAGWIYEGWYRRNDSLNTYTVGVGVGYRWLRLDYGWVPDDAGHKSEVALQVRLGG
jgi:hypothetical protein